jgi:hypothetical protein
VSDDTRRRLEDAGRRPAPPPDPAFAERLEARLLAVAATPPAPEPGGPPPRVSRGRWLALAGATLGALAVAVVLLSRAPGAGAPLELAQPVNVEVALADGTALEVADGLTLPEGAVIRVGEGGFARIGEVELHPGDVGTVREGRVEVERDQDVGSVSETPTPPMDRPTDRATPRPSAAPDRTPRTTPGPTPKPSPKPTSAPDRTPRPSPTPTAPPATPTPEPTPEPTATPDPSPSPSLTVRPRLRAHANPAGNRVVLRWTATRRAASYVLVITRSRVSPAPEPIFPGARFSRTFDAAPDRWLRFRVLDPVVEVKVMVVALGRHGQEVSRSRIVTVPMGDTLADGEPTASVPPPDDPPPASDPPADGG